MTASSSSKRLKLAILSAVLVALAFGAGCTYVYDYQVFCYPPGASLEANNYSHRLSIAARSKGPFVRRCHKGVDVMVVGEGDDVLLEDHLEFDCANVDWEVAWRDFDTIRVELLEVGSETADDAYNRELLDSGPRRLALLIYRWDTADGRFVRAGGISGAHCGATD